jgi:predicted DCC family thiol-disulfide oxidoreductase YuxK
MHQVTLIYDSDCGFCRWCLGKVLAWDRRRSVRPLALGTEEADRLLAGIPAAERMSSWHLVESSGQVHSAGAGFAPLFRSLPGASRLALVADRFPRMTERGYRLVAGNRSLWGHFVTDGAKRRADLKIAARR